MTRFAPNKRLVVAVALLAGLSLALLASVGPATAKSAKPAKFHACKSPGPVDQVDESGNKVHFQVSKLTAAARMKCGKARGVAQRYVTTEKCAPSCTIGSLRCTFRTGKRRGYGCRFKSGADAIRFQIVDSGA